MMQRRKRVLILSFLLYLLCLLPACQTGPLLPDLQAVSLTVNWSSKTASAVIINSGDFPVYDEFFVYFDAEESPVSDNYRPQRIVKITNLPIWLGETRPISSIDFSALARTENNNLGNVYQIRMIIDAKDQVFEKNEMNNETVRPIN